MPDENSIWQFGPSLYKLSEDIFRMILYISRIVKVEIFLKPDTKVDGCIVHAETIWRVFDELYRIGLLKIEPCSSHEYAGITDRGSIATLNYPWCATCEIKNNASSQKIKFIYVLEICGEIGPYQKPQSTCFELIGTWIAPCYEIREYYESSGQWIANEANNLCVIPAAKRVHEKMVELSLLSRISVVHNNLSSNQTLEPSALQEAIENSYTNSGYSIDNFRKTQNEVVPGQRRFAWQDE